MRLGGQRSSKKFLNGSREAKGTGKGCTERKAGPGRPVFRSTGIPVDREKSSTLGVPKMVGWPAAGE
jgi:hypothetical protein